MGENDGSKGRGEVEGTHQQEARRRVGGRWTCPDCVHAWAAGLFDGEGCIGLYRKTHTSGKRGWRLVLKITLRKRTPLEKMYELYGGLMVSTTRSWGSTYPIWILQKPSKIDEVLERWLPWLIEKKTQAIVAREYCKFLSERVANEGYSKRDEERCERWERKLKALKRN